MRGLNKSTGRGGRSAFACVVAVALAGSCGGEGSGSASASGTGDETSDPADFDFCVGEANLLDLSRGDAGFVKSKRWRFFPGDVNGDGVDDLVVDDERGFHFFFRPALLTEDPTIDVDALLAGDGGFSIEVPDDGWDYELVDASADVNGDGRDDALLRKHDPDNYDDDGSELLVAFAPAVGGQLDLSAVGETIPGLRVTGDDLHWPSGVGWVNDVVDLDGDGRAEIVLGRRGVVGDGNFFEDVWIVAGRSETATIALDGPDVSHYNAAQARALDIDGDGALELALDSSGGGRVVKIARAPFDAIEPGLLDLSVLSYSGEEDIESLQVADINGDGRDDILIYTAVIYGGEWPERIDVEDPGANGFAITGRTIGAPLGDVDGDGADDLLIDASKSTPSGRLFVVFGDAYPSPLDLEEDLSAARGYTITGSAIYGDLVGGGPAGDVNGDGLADLWLATSREDEDLVVFGRACP